MLMSLTLLSLVSCIPYTITVLRTCIPNSQFKANGRVCQCDTLGRWSDASCTTDVSRRLPCRPGLIIWKDCSQCICQENGQMVCTNTVCRDVIKPKREEQTTDVKQLHCIPFASYYINCSLCVCPASGKLNEGRCAVDSICPFQGTTDFLAAVKMNICIPKVMYLFPCLQCLCTEDGYFSVSKCVETCSKVTDNAIRCTPMTLYRKNCNVCYCPENGVVNELFCTKSECNHRVKLHALASMRDLTKTCETLAFTRPRCIYCECNQHEIIDERACFEAECLNIDKYKYDYQKSTCTPGEVLAFCIECYCPRTGRTDPKYCTVSCSLHDKIDILEIVIRDSLHNRHIMDIKLIKQSKGALCEPNYIYKYDGQFCVCPENGNADPKLCTHNEHHSEQRIAPPPAIHIDFNAPCNPNTFVDFDCNTCYCLKNGRLDPKWCTYDDCQAKKTIMERHTGQQTAKDLDRGVCTPGSISKSECNFCICPASGLLENRACTKNSCTGLRTKGSSGLTCEPLTYYNVDCNTCYCPKNGIKNVDRCTKNICEKNFLRTDVCVAGKLFSDDCNVCVCPPNGDKADKVCTNNTCSDFDTPWKKIFRLSQNLLSHQSTADSSRSLDLCFPGEEFEIGCKVCLCPDMGLRIYATCSEMLCQDDKAVKRINSSVEAVQPMLQTRRTGEDYCAMFNVSTTEHRPCTPGSSYIIRCRECICPYMGSISHFCRPLPANTYCEQAFPDVNYHPMRRTNSSTNISDVSDVKMINDRNTVTHNHTMYQCATPGRMMDPCFVCDCIKDVIVREHCFLNEDPSCKDKSPTFLGYIKKIEH